MSEVNSLNDFQDFRNRKTGFFLLIALLLLCSGAGAAGLAVNPAATRLPVEYAPLLTTTAVPACTAPCECLSQSAAQDKWGANGYTSCSRTPCGRAATAAAVIPYYCFKPLERIPTATSITSEPRPAVPVNRTQVRVNMTQSILVPAHVDPVVMFLDSDSDGIRNIDDNCPYVANSGQQDTEPGFSVCGTAGGSNGIRTLSCVAMPSGDGVGDACDNCPAVVNPDQEDSDAQSKCSVQTADMGGGVVCVPVTDGFGDACDNCPYVFNADQADSDNNGTGDACQDPCTMNANEVSSFSWTTWRGTNWMTSVKDQAACGSCYAQAPTGTLEAMYNLEQGSQRNLDTAEQVFVSPCFDANPGSCLGGSGSKVMTLLRDHGVPDESVMPYQSTSCVHSVPNAGDPAHSHLECNAGVGAHCANPNSCNLGALAPDHVWKITTFGDSSGTVGHVKQELLCRGPLSVRSGSWWHYVVLTGWDNNVNGGSWLIKNSWGTGWENGGYGWIRFDGEDKSEIRNEATYMSGVYRVGGA